jgi:hypothetical protein
MKMNDTLFKRRINKAIKLPFQQAMERLFELKGENKRAFSRIVVKSGKWAEFCKEHQKEINSILGLDEKRSFHRNKLKKVI